MADTIFSLASRIEQMDDGTIVRGVLGPYIADIPQPRLSRRELNVSKLSFFIDFQCHTHSYPFVGYCQGNVL